ncbi:MAG TPA: class I SAM-dependent methyltransferase [Gaiellaceae bacterium]|nr:class I SAM-dependent methyltransferase [Gaiellaceae bacterium]
MATLVRQEPDPAAVEEFIGRGITDIAGAMTTIFCIVGDRLGLFRALDEGPASAAELAARAAIDERYALEWLRGLASAGYVEETSDGRYVLPPAHAVVLAREGNPLFVGGAFQELGGMLPALERIIAAFQAGGGVPQAAYPDDAYAGMARFTAVWFDHHLLGAWLPLLPELSDRLGRGIRWADVGCGAGRAVIRLAEAFPQSTFAGFDVFPSQVERARAAAEAAGVADRVSFEVADGAQGIPGSWDVISTFDVVHDAVDPDALVASIHRALADDGTYLMLEMNCADDHAENRGPLATALYGFSILYCMTTSLAQGGAGLGTCGCPPAVVEEIGRRAGFGTVREVPIDDPFNRLYELRA